MFPLLGFGGMPDLTKQVSHLFPLNFQFNGNPSVKGIDQMIDTYKAALGQTKLYGPTNFAPLIRKTSEIVKQDNNPMMYTILSYYHRWGYF